MLNFIAIESQAEFLLWMNPWYHSVADSFFVNTCQERGTNMEVKMFKICDPKGYTFNAAIYQGWTVTNKNLSEDIVMRLSEPYLDEYRIIATDNFYTSGPLTWALPRRQNRPIDVH